MRSDLPLFPESASTMAGRIDALYIFLCLLTLGIALGIAGLIVLFAIRYHRRSPDQIGDHGVRGNDILETAWMVGPFIVMMVIFYWGASIFFSIYRPPRDAMDIYVIGKQWMWKFQHPEGQREIDELHVPLDKNVRLIMGTEDVIHSFFVPAFRVKADVVPGYYRYLWFRATKAGRYHLFCAEYCGTNHSRMTGWVIVMPPEEYQAWLLSSGTQGSAAAEGEQLFQQLGCSTCHRLDMQGRGPVLTGLYHKRVLLDTGQTVVADESYIREAILNPRAKIVAGFQPIMPTFQGLLSEEQVLQLIAYVRSLSREGTGGIRP